MRRKLSAEEWLEEEKAVKTLYRERLRNGAPNGIDRDAAASRLRGLGLTQGFVDAELARIRR